MATSGFDILIADAGSTKTDWICLSSGSGEESRIRTNGINAVHTPELEIKRILSDVIESIKNTHTVKRVHFFGAGCGSISHCNRIKDMLLKEWPEAEIEVNSDLVGASISLLGDEEGIACILGTGSNSGLWRKRKIEANTPPLGYILGDEGSGAALGKRLVNAIFKGSLTRETSELFVEETALSLNEVIERVYRSTQPARFLASLAPFIKRHLDRAEIYNLALEEFELFFKKNVENYNGKTNLPLTMTGSIAWHFRDVISYAAERCGLKVTKISQAPMEGLIEYYKKPNR